MNPLNKFSLEGKVALVTGAAYGIGFAIAEALASAGARIAFNCRKKEHLDSALAEYAKRGIEAKGFLWKSILTSMLWRRLSKKVIWKVC